MSSDIGKCSASVKSSPKDHCSVEASAASLVASERRLEPENIKPGPPASNGHLQLYLARLGT